MSYLEVHDVRVIRKGKNILDSVTITGNLGEAVGFIGPNGSGKSMLFKAICGFINIHEGSIKVGEERVGEDVDFPTKTGILIEHAGLIPSMSGYENLYSLSLLTKTVSKADVLELLQLVGLLENKDLKVSKYSLGMKQRLGIVQALMDDPSLVILDEPFNGLDNQGIELLLSIIEDLKKRGKLILLTSHRNEDLEKVCDKFYKVENGVYTPIEV
ncbi:MAG: ATP-binding cassette domain-containing protein [Enterococcus sp.]